LTQKNSEGYLQEQEDFSLSKTRELVKDLFRPNPIIYWVDFLFCAILGWGAFLVALRATIFSSRQILFVVISCLALYRAALFIHEIVHLKKRTFKVFRWTWNMVCGFPLMIPLYLYQSVHFDHHKQKLYGTEKDGEYFPFAINGRRWIFIHVLFSCMIPILLFTRFSVLTPLSMVNKKLRLFLMARMSALVIDFEYQRPESTWQNGNDWKVQEFLTCLFTWTFLGLIIVGIIPVTALFMWYCIGVLIFMINSIRTLGAHRYQNPEESVMSYPEQMLDSVNTPGNRWMTPLWAPVGLRFHATHHLFPDLPYHALGEAHRRLMRDNGENSLYGRTVSSGLVSTLHHLWKHAGNC